MTETSFASTVLALLSQIITSLTTAMTSFTSWIINDELAVFFFALMLIMLVIHLINSLVHQFS